MKVINTETNECETCEGIEDCDLDSFSTEDGINCLCNKSIGGKVLHESKKQCDQCVLDASCTDYGGDGLKECKCLACSNNKLPDKD